MTLHSRTALRITTCLIAMIVAGTAMHVRAQAAYEKVAVTDPEVQAAVKVAVAQQQKKKASALKLVNIVSAERQPVTGLNMRLCLSMDRNGSREFARVVLGRNAKKEWAVNIWSWGSCGR